MGIAKGAACLLYELKRDHPIGGTILQLGKQSLYVEADQLPGIAQRFGFTVDISNILFKFSINVKCFRFFWFRFWLFFF